MDFPLKYFKNQNESPDWHKQELLATEKRFADGKEKFIDWDKANILLRKTYE